MEQDLLLLEQWRGGDNVAGQELLKRHFRDIYRFFEHKARGDADELVQRTFLACLKSRDRFRAQSSFRTYLFAIARNELLMYLRSLWRDPHVDFEITSIAEIVTSPASKLGRAEQHELLRAALQTLPAEQQLLLELHYWHDLDAAALGEVLDATPGTVRVRLLRARRALRQALDQQGTTVLVAEPGDRLAQSFVDGSEDEL